MSVPQSGNGSPPARELPPVEPPSAKFVVQLFLIPLAIVLVLVVGLSLVYLAFGSLATGGHSAGDYVEAIRSGNENRRWRAATDLASLLHNDRQLASNPKLLTDLTRLLAAELGTSKVEDPRVAQFLALTLGVMQWPEQPEPDADPITALTLATQPRFSPDIRIAAVTSLSQQAAKDARARGSEAVQQAIIASVGDDDTQVRQRAVYALGAFDSDATRTLLRGKLGDDPDRLVRYNAAAALARQGDPAAGRVLTEMLSPQDLAQVITEEGREQNQRKIEAIQLEALMSLREGLTRSAAGGSKELFTELRPRLEELSRSGGPQVKVESASLLKLLP